MINAANILTIINLIAGCLAISFLPENPQGFFICMGIALVADLLDGMVARLLNQVSDIGKQLDSLADMVSFGVVPGFVMIYLMGHEGGLPFQYADVAGLVLTIGAALRLARFNTDSQTSQDFSGMPTPAMTIAVIGIYHIHGANVHLEFLDNFTILLIITGLLTFLMLSNIRFISFKIKSLNILDNIYVILLLVSILVSILVYIDGAFLLSIAAYILLSCIYSLTDKKST